MYYLFIALVFIIPLIILGGSIHQAFHRRLDMLNFTLVGVLFGGIWGYASSDSYTAGIIVPFHAYIGMVVGFVVGNIVAGVKAQKRKRIPLKKEG